ncbi:MAG: histidinol-phosphate transaminase [Nitrospirota bacterium]
MDIKSLVRKEVASLSAYEPEDYSGVRIKIDAMENPYPLPDELREGLLQALAEVSLNRYPDPEARRLKAALAGYLGVGAESLVLGNGSDELIAMITQTFGGSPGLVAYPVPTFSMYGIIARSMGQEVMELPLTDDFQIDFDGWLKLFSERRPKVIFISYPNNPTGNLFDPDKIRRLIEGCFSIVVVDEAYFSFSSESLIGKINELPNLAVLRTLSKVGMAGLRLGVMAAGKDIVREVNKVRLPYNINSLSQAAAQHLLVNRAAVDLQVSKIIAERERLFSALNEIDGVTAWPSKTNFILFRVAGASRIHKELKARGILVRNMDVPGPLKDCLRVTVGTPEENEEFISSLKEIRYLFEKR